MNAPIRADYGPVHSASERLLQRRKLMAKTIKKVNNAQENQDRLLLIVSPYPVKLGIVAFRSTKIWAMLNYLLH
jgi:hypothetical protein